jgi:anti-sigma factor RsiW
MTDFMSPHLTDESLNEYLDGLLAAAAQSAAASHLATCTACSERLASLRAVFSGLEQLPPAPLRRDLRAGVMAAVRAQPAAVVRPVADLKRRPVQLAFGLQLLAGLALLAFAWPFVAGLAGLEPAFAPRWLNGLASGLAGTGTVASAFMAAMQAWLAGLAVAPTLPLTASLTPVAAGLVLAGAVVLWLLSNAVLLRAPNTPRWRRPM